MIERVARAIYTRNATAAGGRLPWDKAHAVVKASTRDLARAALEELRVPTEAMIDAAHEAEAEGIAPAEHHREGVRNIIVAAIDAALKEETP